MHHESPKDHKNTCGPHGCCGCGSGHCKKCKQCFALILLVVGLFFVAQDLGWISTSFTFWPVLITLIGAGMLTKKCRK